MRLPGSSDWLGKVNLWGENQVRLLLLDQDLCSAQIALDDYLALDQAAAPAAEAQVTAARRIHHAKSFVCAMRRAGRMFEALSAHRSSLPGMVADAIQVEWRKKKTMFDSYVEPRNAIEHIDGEISGRSIWILVNLNNDRLEVAADKSAEVSKPNLEAAIDGRNQIVQALLAHMPSGSLHRYEAHGVGRKEFRNKRLVGDKS